jgi:aminobenzoyl-glutamate utilization protein B
MTRHALVALIISALVVAAPLAQKNAPAKPGGNAKLDALKQEAVADVESRSAFRAADGRPDLQLRRARLPGIRDQPLPDRHPRRRTASRCRKGIAGIPTAFMATWGSGKPVIALGSDIDCIPQASQKPASPSTSRSSKARPGHGEGHNSGLPLNITAAIAVKKIMAREQLPGTIRIWTGTAEELVGAKAYFIRAGFFKDVDIALFTHVGENLDVSWGERAGNGLVSVQYSFVGETAHAAANPWRGRSALDAVELMDIGWNFRREHLRLSQRSHNVITDGGDQPNVVPRTASVWYYFERPTTRTSRSCGRPATRWPRRRR